MDIRTKHFLPFFTLISMLDRINTNTQLYIQQSLCYIFQLHQITWPACGLSRQGMWRKSTVVIKRRWSAWPLGTSLCNDGQYRANWTLTATACPTWFGCSPVQWIFSLLVVECLLEEFCWENVLYGLLLNLANKNDRVHVFWCVALFYVTFMRKNHI